MNDNNHGNHSNDAPRKSELLDLFQKWANHLGYRTGKIVITSDDELTDCATADCTLTAHAPLWRTKPGEETAVPVSEVRRTLRRMLKFAKVRRYDMHVAVQGTTLCLFFIVKIQFRPMPLFTAMTVPLAFVVEAVDTPQGLRFSEIHEWPASSVDEALKVLEKHHGWPAGSKFEKHVDFGAAS